MPHSCDLVLQTELVSQRGDSLGSGQLPQTVTRPSQPVGLRAR